ncbi:non-heme iron oxygenase ferredoxin subunit [Candidatus Bathyarchaeota archaeon]|nr:MAG: non-heme iron oxygenase ferredoxin subunit [Candidatus Bathyarchaeota archaeon]
MEATQGTAHLVKVCQISELPPGTMKGTEFEGRRILVANIDGKIYAHDGTCTHEEADLSNGFILGDRVVCPLHLSQFDLRTGEAVTSPAVEPLKNYKVKIEGPDVYVEVD